MNFQKNISENTKLNFESLDCNLFVVEPPNDFICTICDNIPNPECCYEVTCCGHLFCENCMTRNRTFKDKMYKICDICLKLRLEKNTFYYYVKM